MTKPKFKSSFADPLDMAGTEGTHSYIVLAYSPLGRVGYRLLSGRMIRVRIEPENDIAADKLAKHFPVGEWKQPEPLGQFRFSRVFDKSDATIKAIELAIKELGRSTSLAEILKGLLGKPTLTRNSKARLWRQVVVKHQATP